MLIIDVKDSGAYALKHGIHARDAVWLSEADGMDAVRLVAATAPKDVTVVLLDKYPSKDMRDSNLYQMFGFAYDNHHAA